MEKKNNLAPKCHLVVRFADPEIDEATVKTIDEHKKILKKHKEVVFGKIGKPLGDKNIDRLNDQLKEGIPTYLYLVKKDKERKYLVYECKLEEISRSPIKSASHPAYYSELRGFKMWMLLSAIEESTTDRMLQLKTISSLQPVLKSLQSSMAPLFMVKE